MNVNLLLDIGISRSLFSEIVANIHEAVLDGDWAKPMLQIAEATKSNKAFFILQNLNKPELPVWIEWHTTFDHPPEPLLNYHSDHYVDPFYPASTLITEGETIYANDFVAEEDFLHTDYYREVLAPLRSHQILGGCPIRDGNYESIWAVNRGPEDERYSQADINLVSLLTPHFHRALHTHINLQLYRKYVGLGQRVIEQTSKALVVCKSDGKTIYKNACAEALALSAGLFSLEGGSFLLNDSLDQVRISRYIQQCSSYSFRDISLQESMLVESAGNTFFISVAPLRREDREDGLQADCALITIAPQASINWLLVTAEFHLTTKEIKLLKEIYRKRKLNELTEEFGVTYNTLRTHLQNVFKKAKVNSQSELMIKINLFNT